MEEERTERAGVLALIFSFLIPLVGIICYFSNKREVENASAYLWAALGGFVVGMLMRIAA
ncbi:hypothetical protein [Xylanibacter ruminicola]|uniref:Uncharacterized protein n=1 Tax=Xylanibacter ruminicola TaxID=839 RepID=A0A1M6VGC7_XYLRU|nr:hypothetical protein [Xylanibacter ruminicola]SHK80530.1 hypothetical protein SAMN05216463_112109 [Xylanibacter ruminicola]